MNSSERQPTWRARLDACRATGQRVGLVPTMGALHAGHLSLIRGPRPTATWWPSPSTSIRCSSGPSEDLAAYPRHLDEDCRLAGEAGAHLVFAPTTERARGPSRPAPRVARQRPHRDHWKGRPARPLRRGGHHRGQAVRSVRAVLGLLRGEGLPAAGGHPPPGRRPVAARRGLRLPDRPRSRRPGPVEPQRLSHPGGARVAPRSSTTPCWPASGPSRTTRATDPAAGLDGHGRGPGPSPGLRPRLRRGGRPRAFDPARPRRWRGASAHRRPPRPGPPHRQPRRHPSGPDRRRARRRPRRFSRPSHSPPRTTEETENRVRRRMLKSKIHRATVTDADLNYVGSISLDPALMRRGRYPRA